MSILHFYIATFSLCSILFFLYNFLCNYLFIRTEEDSVIIKTYTLFFNLLFLYMYHLFMLINFSTSNNNSMLVRWPYILFIA